MSNNTDNNVLSQVKNMVVNGTLESPELAINKVVTQRIKPFIAAIKKSNNPPETLRQVYRLGISDNTKLNNALQASQDAIGAFNYSPSGELSPKEQFIDWRIEGLLERLANGASPKVILMLAYGFGVCDADLTLSQLFGD